MAQIEISIDYKDLEKKLGQHKKLAPWIWEDMVRKAQNQVVREVKSEIAARGYRRGKSGHLYKNVFQFTSKNGKMFSYVGFKHRTFAYSNLTQKTSISAVNGEYLTFYKDGSWHKVKEVTLNPTDDFLNRIVNDWWQSGKAEPIMQAEFDRQLQKIYQKELNRLAR